MPRTLPLKAKACRLVPAVLVSACTGTSPSPAPASSRSAQVVTSDRAEQLQMGQVRVDLPSGAAPRGTTAIIQAAAEPTVDASLVTIVAPTVSLSLSGRQPARPLTIHVHVPKAQLGLASPDVTDVAVFLLAVSETGEKEIIRGHYDDATQTFTATVRRVSSFTLVHVDWAGAINSARGVLIESLTLQAPQPDCVGKSVTMFDTVFDVTSPAQVWSCVGTDATGRLRMEAISNNPVPLIVYSNWRPKATYEPLQTLTSSDSLAIAIVQRLAASEPRGNGIALMRGLRVVHTFEKPALGLEQDVQQYPIAIHVQLLTTTVQTALAALGMNLPAQVRAVDQLACMDTLSNTAHTMRASNSREATLAFVKGMSGCAGEAVSGPAAVMFSLVTTAPQFFAVALIGAYSEVLTALQLSDDASFSIPLATAPVLPGGGPSPSSALKQYTNARFN